jgi:hypothetical protein
MRTIGIVGRDFCGSTLLSRLLSCVEGVTPVGEMHWLIDAPSGGAIITDAGWPVTRKCVVHGDSCTKLTPEFVDAPHSPSTLYSEVAKAMGASTLVSADKRISHYERFTKPGELDAIVLFKTPQNQVVSDIRNEKREFERSLARWTFVYESIIGWCTFHRYPKSFIFVSYEDLVADPLNMMIAICSNLELPKPPYDIAEKFEKSATEKRYHCIGCSPHSHMHTTIKFDASTQCLTRHQKSLCMTGQTGIILDSLNRLKIAP